MYLPFFGLKQTPFSIAPDPHYLFMSERHREALAHLLYGVSGGGGFVLLTGEIGAGKTTVCRCFLDQMPADCNVAYIFNPKLSAIELLQTVCDEFRVPVRIGAGSGAASVKDYVDPLNAYLLAQHAAGRNNLLIVDEAQNLSAEVLEQLRLLTNLETRERKLLQVVLIGQPELRDMLARPELEQLAQRVIARYHLGALSEDETTQYVEHRLRVAGLQGPLPLDRAALRRVHAESRGVPRRINLVCDRALLGAYALGEARVTAAVVRQAATEVLGEARAPRGRMADERTSAGGRSWSLVLGAAALAILSSAVALAVAAWVLRAGRGDAPSAAGASSPTAGPPASTPAAASAVASAPGSSPPLPLPLPEVLLLADLQPSPGEAWQALAQLWGLALPASAEPCAALLPQGLQCYRNAAGSLSLIRLLDRPVLLRLQLPGRPAAEVLLLGLDSQYATLSVAGQPRRLALEALAQVWRGEFTALWRAPPGYASRDENSGVLFGWVGERLAHAAGATSGAALTPEIQAFQARQGVQPDGRLGPITLMLLNRASGVAEPALAPAR